MTEDAFLFESQSHRIDGARRIGYRPGWVIRDGGVEVWLPDDEFQRNYVEIADAPVDLGIIGEIIDSGRRVLSQTVHPDKGGSHETMVEVNRGAHWLKELATKFHQSR